MFSVFLRVPAWFVLRGFFVSAAASLQSPVDNLQALRVESLRALLPAPLPQAPGLPTGLAALDRALASGGLPRGRLSEIVGATGKLTLLRPIVEEIGRAHV